MTTEIPKDKPLFVLIDSNALIHRAYHAYPPTLTLPDGSPVNAVYGFTSLLLEVLNKFKPGYVICAFDSHKPTIRHGEYVGYKATRKKTESDLIEQFPITYEVVKAFNIPMYKVDGFEADDIIGTLAKRDDLDGEITRLIVTGDHDLLQLVDENTFVYMAGSSFSKSKLYGIEEVKERYGFGPEFITDFKAIKGDTSDNIPGVAGIGDKGATDLINQFGHIDEIYKHIEETGKNQKKLIDGHDSAMLSKRLATIMLDTPLNFTLEEARLSDFSYEEVATLFQRLRFRSLVAKIPHSSRPVESSSQQSLFGISGGGESKTETKKVENISDVEEFVKQISNDRISIMTFADENNCLNQKMLGASFYSNGKSLFISETELKDERTRSVLQSVLTDNKIKKITYDLKSTTHCFTNNNLTLDDNVEDVSLMAYLVMQGEGSYDLKDLAFGEVGMVIKEEKDLLGVGKEKITYDQIAQTDIVNSLAISVEVLDKVYDGLIAKLTTKENERLEKLYRNVEIPVARILGKMERNGIQVDKEYLVNFKKELEDEIATIIKEVHHDIGHEFSVSSPKQVGEVLFGELALPGGKKGKSGAYSTNERILRDLVEAHPAVNKILRFRELDKLRSTYTDALISKIDDKTGRIHSRFRQTVASSGRLASSDPNLQNIPVSTEDGMKIRRAFVAPESKMLVAFDISQQELRVIANMSGEERLIQAFKNNEDIHKITASGMFDIPVDKVTKKERDIGKTMNYSLLYGISAFGLADRLKVNHEDASMFIKKFWEAYPKIKSFFDKYIDDAKEKGYAETYFGRQRSAKNLSSSNFRIREAARRELINFPVQGSSADLMKMAMIAVDGELPNFKELDPKLMLQVHDELVIEINEAEVSQTKQFTDKIVQVMENVVDFDVPLEVEAKIAKTWAEAK